MDYKKLLKALLCDGSGVGEDINGCTNKKCKYRDGDGGCNLVRMCGDAAIAINELLTENQALRNAANGFKKQAEAAETRAEKAEREKDATVQFLTSIIRYGTSPCECCKADCIDAGSDDAEYVSQCGAFEWSSQKKEE